MYVYVLSDGEAALYVGITRDLEVRFKCHASRRVTSTKHFKSYYLIHWWNPPTYILASKLERWCHSNMNKVIELVLDCPIWCKVLRQLADTKKTTQYELIRAVEYSRWQTNKMASRVTQ